jgi:hypothetical protein
MSRRFLLLLLAAGIGTGWAAGGEPAGAKRAAAEKAAAEKVARLVADLGSDDFETRAGAAQQLEALGPAVGPALQKAAVSADPEVRRLALEVAEKVARKMESAEVLEPHRFRFVCRDMPLHAAVADFARASGAQINLEGVKTTNRKITLDTGYTTFWDAFDKLCAAAGLAEKVYDTPANEAGHNGGYAETMIVGRRRRMIMWNGRVAPQNDIIPALRNGQFVLTDAGAPARPSYQAGALRFRALPPGTSLGSFSSLKGDKELVFGLEVIPEPSLTWERVQCLRIDRAIDDQGQVLTATQAHLGGEAPPNEMDEMVFYGDMGTPQRTNAGQRLPLRLALGRKPSSVLKELSGVATIKMQTSTQDIAAVDNILKAENKSVKGADGSFLKVVAVKREEGGKFDVHVQIDPAPEEQQNVNPWGFRRVWWGGGIRQNDEQTDSSVSTGNLALFDVRGNLIRQVSKEVVEDPNGTGLEEYHFLYQVPAGAPEPAKLVLQGRRAVTIDVPFTLRDVPLKALPGVVRAAPAPAAPQQQQLPPVPLPR